jgi:hypothetical protein
MTPFSTLAQAAESMAGVRNMHITARMRTVAGDNFELVSPDYGFLPIETWETFGGTPKWRMHKPGRTVTMDGASTVMLMHPELGSTWVAKFPPNSVGLIGSLAPLLHIDTLFAREQEAARKQGAQVSVQMETDQTGVAQVVLTINAQAKGDFSQSDYAKNTSIIESDNTRVYRFDAVTHRLRGMQVYMHVNGATVLVFESTAIEYDTSIDPSLLVATIPNGARMLELPGITTAATGNAAKTPKAAAEIIFKSLSERDWATLHAYMGTIGDDPKFQEEFGGLTVISIGDAFRSGAGTGWFVPFEIRLHSGQVIKHNLAVRNDNPQHAWVWSGGL